ncbi:MAG: hypothetical protein IIZ92_04770 [Aquincola sp.]|nr:hypothetical protein [Aquincola sp.]
MQHLQSVSVLGRSSSKAGQAARRFGILVEVLTQQKAGFRMTLRMCALQQRRLQFKVGPPSQLRLLLGAIRKDKGL